MIYLHFIGQNIQCSPLVSSRHREYWLSLWSLPSYQERTSSLSSCFGQRNLSVSDIPSNHARGCLLEVDVYGHDPVEVGLRGLPVAFCVMVGAVINLSCLSIFKGRNKEIMIISCVLMTAGKYSPPPAQLHF